MGRYRSIFVSCGIGLICGFVSCVCISLLDDLVWRGYMHYNPNVSFIQYTQLIALAIFVPVVAGVLAAISIDDAGHNKKFTLMGSAITGAIAGFTAPLFMLMVALFQLSPIFVPEVPGAYTMFDGFMENPMGFLITSVVRGTPLYSIFAVISALLAVMGAFFFLSLLAKSPEDKTGSTVRKSAIMAIISAMILIIIVPPSFAYMALDAGLIQGGVHPMDYVIAVTAHRNSNDSISVTYNGGPDADAFLEKGSFIVQVNDKNATNMEAIGQSGLAATLDPTSGLNVKVGSVMNITGSDISRPTHVVVIARFDDEVSVCILDSRV